MTAIVLENLREDLSNEKAVGICSSYFSEEAEIFSRGSPPPAMGEIDLRPSICEEEKTYTNTESLDFEFSEELKPRTPLVRQLLAIRRQAIRQGLKLLSLEEVLEEVQRRRGEIPNNESHIS